MPWRLHFLTTLHYKGCRTVDRTRGFDGVLAYGVVWPTVKKKDFMTMMITIMLENPGDWVMMGESRSGGCIKSDVRNFIAGPLANLDKPDRRFTKGRLGSFILSSGIQYIRTYVLHPLPLKKQRKTKGRSSKHLIDDDPGAISDHRSGLRSHI